jgi:geranylgeranyl diphosphate synthase, type I
LSTHQAAARNSSPMTYAVDSPAGRSVLTTTLEYVQTAWDTDSFRAEIGAVLAEFLDEQAQRLIPLGADAERLVEAARRAVGGGKRFRAAFCYWGFRAIQPSPPDERALLRACAALELLHASALVHDDYMDASDTRRGHPATHRAFEAAHRDAGWRGDPEQYGAAAAILLGDLLQAWADELLRTSGLTDDPTTGLLVFDLTRSEVIAGQFLDVSVQARGAADVDAAMTVLRYKSAKYSIERPVQLGAALAGADATALAELSAYGLPLGEAFQLRDDLLGVFGDPAVTGKPAGDDLVEGKRTVLVALALDAADTAPGQRLDAALGTPLTVEEVAELREIIDESGAHQQVEEVISMLVERSLKALDDAGIDDSARAELRTLAAAATDRAV